MNYINEEQYYHIELNFVKGIHKPIKNSLIKPLQMMERRYGKIRS